MRSSCCDDIYILCVELGVLRPQSCRQTYRGQARAHITTVSSLYSGAPVYHISPHQDIGNSNLVIIIFDVKSRICFGSQIDKMFLEVYYHELECIFVAWFNLFSFMFCATEQT